MKRCIALFNDGWADWEAGPILAGLREDLGWRIQIATPKGQDAQSIGGVRARADMGFGDVETTKMDLLLVIGSEQWTQREHPEVYELLRRTVTAGVPVGAICAGTIAAARSGILDDRAHTSNSLKFLEQYVPRFPGKATYRDVPHAVSDRGVVTAPGSAPATFAAEVIRLVEQERGDSVAREFLAMMKAEHS